jgi:hypothetical protein
MSKASLRLPKSNKPFSQLKKSSRKTKVALLNDALELLSGGDSRSLLEAYFSSEKGEEYKTVLKNQKYGRLVSRIQDQYGKVANQQKRQFLSFLVEIEDRPSLKKAFNWSVGKEAWKSAQKHRETHGPGISDFFIE